MDIPPEKPGKKKAKKKGPYEDPDQVPAGGRAHERVLQHRKARGFGDPMEVTGEFVETVDLVDEDEGSDSPAGEAGEPDDSRLEEVETGRDREEE